MQAITINGRGGYTVEFKVMGFLDGQIAQFSVVGPRGAWYLLRQFEGDRFDLISLSAKTLGASMPKSVTVGGLS